MKFLINGGTATGPSTVAVRYAPIDLTAFNLLAWDATEVLRSGPCAGAMTLSEMYVEVAGAPGVGNSYEYCVMKNGVATALAVTISGASTTGNITGQSVSFAEGDLISMRHTPVSGPVGSAWNSWSILAESVTTDYSVIFGHTGALATAATDYYTAMSGSATNATETNKGGPVPLNGDIDNLYVKLGTAPGAGNDRDLTLMVNGVASALTVNIGEAATTGNDTANVVTVAAGERITLRNVPTSGPAASTGLWSMRVIPDTPGESFILNGIASSPSNTAVNYSQIPETAAWDATESIRRNVFAACTIKKVYAILTTAPGAGDNWNFKVRVEGADGAISLTIADAATTGNDTDDVAITNGQTVGYSCTPTGTPTTMAGGVKLGALVYIAPPPSAATGVGWTSSRGGMW